MSAAFAPPTRRVRLGIALAVAFAIANVLPATSVSAQRSARESVAGVTNFGRVTDTYFRGGAVTAEGVRNLYAMGVRTIVDLRDKPSPGEPEACRELGITYHKFPTSGSAVPDSAEMNRILGIITSAGEPVYVHCSAGKHRAGTVCALYRMRVQGWSEDRAWAEQQSYGFGPAEGHPELYAFAYGSDGVVKGATAGADTVASAKPRPAARTRYTEQPAAARTWRPAADTRGPEPRDEAAPEKSDQDERSGRVLERDRKSDDDDDEASDDDGRDRASGKNRRHDGDDDHHGKSRHRKHKDDADDDRDKEDRDDSGDDGDSDRKDRKEKKKEDRDESGSESDGKSSSPDDNRDSGAPPADEVVEPASGASASEPAAPAAGPAGAQAGGVLRASDSYLSMQDAIAKAKAAGGTGDVLQVDLEYDVLRGFATCDVTFSSGTEVEMHAVSGEILAQKQKDPRKLAVLEALTGGGHKLLSFVDLIGRVRNASGQDVVEMELKRLKGRSDVMFEVVTADGATAFYDATTGDPVTGM